MTQGLKPDLPRLSGEPILRESEDQGFARSAPMFRRWSEAVVLLRTRRRRFRSTRPGAFAHHPSRTRPRPSFPTPIRQNCSRQSLMCQCTANVDTNSSGSRFNYDILDTSLTHSRHQPTVVFLLETTKKSVSTLQFFLLLKCLCFFVCFFHFAFFLTIIITLCLRSVCRWKSCVCSKAAAAGCDYHKNKVH